MQSWKCIYWKNELMSSIVLVYIVLPVLFSLLPLVCPVERLCRALSNFHLCSNSHSHMLLLVPLSLFFVISSTPALPFSSVLTMGGDMKTSYSYSRCPFRQLANVIWVPGLWYFDPCKKYISTSCLQGQYILSIMFLHIIWYLLIVHCLLSLSEINIFYCFTVYCLLEWPFDHTEYKKGIIF